MFSLEVRIKLSLPTKPLSEPRTTIMNEDLEVLLIKYTYNGARGSRHVGRLNMYA